MSEKAKLGLIAGIFLALYYAPFSHPRVQNSILEAFWMLQDYAHHHVLTCLIPAFFIAGAISVFVSQASVMKYFGAKANKFPFVWRGLPGQALRKSRGFRTLDADRNGSRSRAPGRILHSQAYPAGPISPQGGPP